MIKNFVKILELLGDRLEVCVSVLAESLFAWWRGVSSGLIIYLAALKKGTIWAAHPYYVIYR